MGIHAVDALQRIVGPIDQVAAFLQHQVHIYAAEDSTRTLLSFEGGAQGCREANVNCSQNDLEIIGITGGLWSNEWLGRDFAGDLHLE